jgi:hypothetical protein
VDPAVPAPADAPAPPGTRWKEVAETGPSAPPAAGALKSAESVFGGKARVIKKPSGGA